MLPVDTKITDLALSAANKLTTVAIAAQQSFINRGEAIWTLTCALACGEHVILLGPPGTAKTSLTSYYAKSLGLSYFSYALNPDTLRDDLFGTINPKSFEMGKWDRNWAGLATNQLVFLDETGKASGQVVNMLVDAMEERIARMGANQIKIPLHTLIGATNESVYDLSPAIWDRFTLRSLVSYVNQPGDFLAMLTSTIDNPPNCPLTEMETANMLYQVKVMAADPPEPVKMKLKEIWQGFLLNFRQDLVISDRRWRRVLRVAAGFSLLSGKTVICEESLVVLKYMLWNEESQIAQVEEFLKRHLSIDATPACLTSGVNVGNMLAELETKLANTPTLKDKAQAKIALQRLERTNLTPPLTARVGELLKQLGR
jgi:MoxR-like ATPase